jgi:hypothetical protein
MQQTVDTEKKIMHEALTETQDSVSLDSLNPDRVSPLHIMEGKLAVLSQVAGLNNNIERLQDAASQLALLEIRIQEIERNIPASESKAKNFSSIDNPEVLENIKTTINDDIDYRQRSVEQSVSKLSEDNPFDPGAHWSSRKVITDMYSKIDTIVLLNAQLEGSKYSILQHGIDLLQSGNLTDGVSLLNESISAQSSLPGSSSIVETISSMRSAMQQGDYGLANSVFSNDMSSLLAIAGTDENSLMLQKLTSQLSEIPQENLETMGYRFPNSPRIFSPELLPYLRIGSNLDELSSQNPSLAKQVLTHRHRLWDTQIDWENPAALELDMRLVTTSYAVLKRLSILTNSLQSGLEEIEHTRPQEDKRRAREEMVDTFWGLYYETRGHVIHEVSDAFKAITRAIPENQMESLVVSLLKDNESPEILKEAIHQSILDSSIKVSPQVFEVIRNIDSSRDYSSALSGQSSNPSADSLHATIAQCIDMAHPFNMILKRLDQYQTGSHGTLYEGEVLSSAKQTFDASTQGINTIVNSFEEILRNAGAHPDEVKNVLETFLERNKNHPELDKIRNWANSFSTRYAILGVRWFDIPK